MGLGEMPLSEDSAGVGRPLQWGLALHTVTSFLSEAVGLPKVTSGEHLQVASSKECCQRGLERVCGFITVSHQSWGAQDPCELPQPRPGALCLLCVLPGCRVPAWPGVQP